MTQEEREKAIEILSRFAMNNVKHFKPDLMKALIMGIKALQTESCEDTISRQAAIDIAIEAVDKWDGGFSVERSRIITEALNELPSVQPEPKTGHCKDCKWWKDSDGVFRRGIGAESQCPINRKEVYEGNGYCYMFEPKESEEA